MTRALPASPSLPCSDAVPGDGLLPLLLRGEHATAFWEHYRREPFGSQGGAAVLPDPLTDERLDDLIEQTACDLTLVRDGRISRRHRPLRTVDAWQEVSAGSTLVYRHVERHDATVARLSGALIRDVPGVVDAHIYVTPAGHHGFGWHYDAEEVFFLHFTGVKDFFLRRNTVNPHPVPETMPEDLRFSEETSPVLQCRVRAGDWLYIPRGWWHMAIARSDCRSLSLGLLESTARG